MKKNLLFVTRTMNLGGTEKVIMQLCKSFKDSFDNIYVCSSGGENVKFLSDLGIEHITIPDISSKNPINILVSKRIIKKIIKDKKIDIVHTHHRMAAFICRNFKNVKLINTIHNTFSDKKILTRISYNNYINIAVGKSVYDNMVDYYNLSKSKITTIINSINSSFFYEEIDDFSINKQQQITTFVYVGRFDEQKGIDILLKAVESLNENYIVYFYGDGPQKDLILKSQCKRVKLMGYTKNPLNVISQSDCVILPSRWEGLPLILIESLSLGVPAICSNISSNIELISDGIDGYTFTTNNSSELSDCIYKFIHNANKKILKDNAKKKYKENFSYSNFLEKYKKIYEV